MARLLWWRRSRGRRSAVILVGSTGGPPDRRLPRAGAQPTVDAIEIASSAATPGEDEPIPPAPAPQSPPAVWAPTATFPDAVDVPVPLESSAPELPTFDDVLARLESPPVDVPVMVPAPRAPEPIPFEGPTPRPARVSLGLGADPLVPLASDDPLAAELAATVDRLLGDAHRATRRGGRP